MGLIWLVQMANGWQATSYKRWRGRKSGLVCIMSSPTADDFLPNLDLRRRRETHSRWWEWQWRFCTPATSMVTLSGVSERLCASVTKEKCKYQIYCVRERKKKIFLSIRRPWRNGDTNGNIKATADLLPRLFPFPFPVSHDLFNFPTIGFLCLVLLLFSTPTGMVDHLEKSAKNIACLSVRTRVLIGRALWIWPIIFDWTHFDFS